MNATAEAVAEVVKAAAGDDGDGGGKCELLGPFALFVQGALGALALLVLLWKRSREHPQRRLLVWFMDVSKQVLGAILVHMANLLLSLISSGSFSTEPSPASIGMVAARSFLERGGEEGKDTEPPQHQNNPCSFYLLNLAIDTTIGVVILIYVLRLYHKMAAACPTEWFRTGITSGYYGDPPKWSYWAKQAFIYFSGLMTMKIIVALIFAFFPWLGIVGDFLLGWTEGNRQLQVFFVMFFFPLVMNAFQYYVIDSFIKHKDPEQTVLRDGAPPDDEPDLHHPRRSFNYDSDSNESSASATARRRLLEVPKASKPPKEKKSPASSAIAVHEYNPEVDGSNSPPEASTSSAPSTSGSGYFVKKGGAGESKKSRADTVRSQVSRNSSMMLLPGSRGPSTPGYDEEMSMESNGNGRGGRTWAEDESTLVER